MIDKDIDDMLNQLRKPKDISKLTNSEKAVIITLFLIGYMAKPIGISDKLLEKCVVAFNENRGKTEIEQEAIFKVLEEKNKIKEK